ncbi:MAG: polysulfide reductase NrfD [Candidatus Lindowbacteria bacterium]|nr:polysulfide reductase NrfD [Candidatus Lindowbacteria bacterium]
MDILASIGRVVLVILSVYFVLKVKDLYNRGALPLLLDGSQESRMFMLEMGLGVVAPLALLAARKVRESQGGLFIASVMVVMGFVMNRLNVSITGMMRSSGAAYFPSWMEIGATMFLVAVGFALFAAAVKYLHVFPEEPARESGESLELLVPQRTTPLNVGAEPAFVKET